MAVTLTVSDLATSPTGILAMFAGTTGGTVLLFTGVFGSDGIVTWTQAGSRVGDGTLAVTLDAGFILAYALDGTDVSPVVSAVVTDGQAAILTQIRESVIARIQSLNFDLYGGVKFQVSPDESQLSFPCVLVTHEDVFPTRETVVVGTSDAGYPVRVLICDRASRFDPSKAPGYELIRQRITRAFDGQRLTGVRQVLMCSVEDDVYSKQELIRYEFMVSQLVIRVKAREPVGYGA